VVPVSAVFVLVDTSATWMAPGNEKRNQDVLAETTRAVLDLISKIDTPASITVAAIGADSILQQPACDAIYRRKLIGTSTKSKREFVRKERLANYLELCMLMLVKRPIAKWTDIRGALSLVSQLANSPTLRERFLFVVSDLKEERPAGPAPLIHLTGFRVASVYRILPEDSRNPRALDERLARWNALLKDNGVARSVDVLDSGRFAGATVRRLLDKEK
jgi:hypothetical protein